MSGPVEADRALSEAILANLRGNAAVVELLGGRIHDETHAQAARRHYAAAMEHARLAADEGAAHLTRALESAADLCDLQILPAGVREEYRQLADHLDGRTQSIAALMARSGR